MLPKKILRDHINGKFECRQWSLASTRGALCCDVTTIK